MFCYENCFHLVDLVCMFSDFERIVLHISYTLILVSCQGETKGPRLFDCRPSRCCRATTTWNEMMLMLLPSSTTTYRLRSRERTKMVNTWERKRALSVECFGMAYNSHFSQPRRWVSLSLLLSFGASHGKVFLPHLRLCECKKRGSFRSIYCINLNLIIVKLLKLINF